MNVELHVTVWVTFIVIAIATGFVYYRLKTSGRALQADILLGIGMFCLAMFVLYPHLMSWLG